MTLNDLYKSLKDLPADAPLVFVSDAGPVVGGYHVTELKRATIASIDCGARVAEWTEAALQLLDGSGGEFMPVGKFSAILAQSLARVAGLGDCPLHVEFAPANQGMRIWQPSMPDIDGSQVTIRLTESRAHCKPALEAMAGSQDACCPSAQSARPCCG